MGMYDTFVTSSAFICPDCGTEINSIQTKEFDKSLDIYHPRRYYKRPGNQEWNC